MVASTGAAAIKSNTDTTFMPLVRESNVIGDDRYLTEMTERLRKLRVLMGEQIDRQGRTKRWIGRHDPSGSF
jgi:hypothetical protein